MNKAKLHLILLSISLILISCSGERASSPSSPVRAAVIGGMTLTGLWDEIQTQFEADTGIPIELVESGPKPVLARVMKEGRVDFLTMHSSDQTSNLVADGWAHNLRPWAKNDLVIVGPVTDPAGISEMNDGTEAVKKIAATKSRWIDYQSNGPRETAHTLFANAGVRMIGPWVLKDETTGARDTLHYAAAQGAYMIVGRMPVLFKKMDPDPNIKIMVQGDPGMRRPYMLMTVNPEKFPNANVGGAEKLADFLLSDKIQKFLASYDGGIGDGIPIFHPIRKVNESK
jgi:tungstate transport system substrate-binding protein